MAYDEKLKDKQRSGTDTIRSHILPSKPKGKREDHWSCIAHLSAEDMLKSTVIEKKKFKNIEYD